MPFQTTNQGNGEIANAITKIFVGDPAADAAYRNQQIKNETEYTKQGYIAAQTLSESVRQKKLEAEALSEINRRAQMDASANASNASASEATARTKEQQMRNNALSEIGNLMMESYNQPSAVPAKDYSQVGGMSVPGDAPYEEPKPVFNLEQQAPRIVQNVLQGGIDPKNLSALALMPGVDNQDLGSIFAAQGQKLGKEDYVSVDDRNTNRRFDVAGGSRLADGDGGVLLDVDPRTYDSKEGAPKLPQDELNAMIANSIRAKGGNIPMNDAQTLSMSVSQYLSGQPELYGNMNRVIEQAYKQSNGNAAAVQAALDNYLKDVNFATFREGEYDEPGDYNPVVTQDVNGILESLGVGARPAAPAGAPAGGNGWKVIGVK